MKNVQELTEAVMLLATGCQYRTADSVLPSCRSGHSEHVELESLFLEVLVFLDRFHSSRLYRIII